MILILGAIKEEIRILSEALDGKKIYFSNDDLSDFISVRECGVGSVEAALSMCEILSTDDFSEALFLGSAGSYKNSNLEFISATHFSKKDLASAEGRSKIPGLMSSAVTTEQGSLGLHLSKKLQLKNRPVNSPDSVTLIHAEELFNDEYENMEAFGLAFTAARANIPFSALMPVTNRVGPDGSLEWSKNFRIMSERIQKMILQHIKTE
ncbi:MAG: hypothetical protein OEZ34_13360 [Spirochaetia bacterium]|nr:hypothetical protein [Spirochaetia bacterium]